MKPFATRIVLTEEQLEQLKEMKSKVIEADAQGYNGVCIAQVFPGILRRSIEFVFLPGIWGQSVLKFLELIDEIRIVGGGK